MNKYIPAAAHSGGYGIDFSQPSEDVNAGVSFVAKKLLEHGVTSFCPTLVTSPPSVYHKVPPALNQHQEPQELLLLLLFCSPMVSDFVQESVFCQCEISDVVFVVVCVCVCVFFKVLPQVRVHSGGADGAGVLGKTVCS